MSKRGTLYDISTRYPHSWGNIQQRNSRWRRKPSVVSLVHDTYYNSTTDSDGKAIKVISDVTGKCLGYMPHEDTEKFWDVTKMILIVGKYKGNYSGKLVKTTPPSKKQYAFVKAKREEGVLAEMPPYDKTIYQYVIAELS